MASSIGGPNHARSPARMQRPDCQDFVAESICPPNFLDGLPPPAKSPAMPKPAKKSPKKFARKRPKKRRADRDGAWKEALRRHLRQFLFILFPDVHKAIDWTQPVVFLDKELRAVARKAKLGKRHADVFVQVTLKNGETQLLFLHVEVQNQRDERLPRRMYGYNYRLEDYVGQEVVSLAILADGDPKWRPDRYVRKTLNNRLEFVFGSRKLLDFESQRAQRLQKADAAGLLILAQLDELKFRRKPAELRQRKFGLIKQLYTAGHSKEDVQAIYELIDWMITLPDLEESRLMAEVEAYEAEQTMPYITSAERIGIEKGIEKGRRKSLIQSLEIRFGPLKHEVTKRVDLLDEEQIDELFPHSIQAKSLAEFCKHLPDEVAVG